MHLYINVHNFVMFLDDDLTNYYIVLKESIFKVVFFFIEKHKKWIYLPSTISVAFIIELLQKFSFGKSENIRGKTWFSSNGTYSEPAPTNWIIDSCR
jgi:hypothetical protein